MKDNNIVKEVIDALKSQKTLTRRQVLKFMTVSLGSGVAIGCGAKPDIQPQSDITAIPNPAAESKELKPSGIQRYAVEYVAESGANPNAIFYNGLLEACNCDLEYYSDKVLRLSSALADPYLQIQKAVWLIDNRQTQNPSSDVANYEPTGTKVIRLKPTTSSVSVSYGVLYGGNTLVPTAITLNLEPYDFVQTITGFIAQTQESETLNNRIHNVVELKSPPGKFNYILGKTNFAKVDGGDPILLNFLVDKQDSIKDSELNDYSMHFNPDNFIGLYDSRNKNSRQNLSNLVNIANTNPNSLFVVSVEGISDISSIREEYETTVGWPDNLLLVGVGIGIGENTICDLRYGGRQSIGTSVLPEVASALTATFIKELKKDPDLSVKKFLEENLYLN